MLVGIPPAEAEVNAANKRQSIVDHDEFLVVRLIESVSFRSSHHELE